MRALRGDASLALSSPPTPVQPLASHEHRAHGRRHQHVPASVPAHAVLVVQAQGDRSVARSTRTRPSPPSFPSSSSRAPRLTDLAPPSSDGIVCTGEKKIKLEQPLGPSLPELLLSLALRTGLIQTNASRPLASVKLAGSKLVFSQRSAPALLSGATSTLKGTLTPSLRLLSR